uniref:GH3 domain containing n=1 Tax=Nothoprocta perdicaria TaxID=30464 RepID=A0A8C6YRG0_NOTPE
MLPIAPVLCAVLALCVALALCMVVAMTAVLPVPLWLRHWVARAVLCHAGSCQRRRLQLRSAEVQPAQERRLRRLLPAGAAAGERRARRNCGAQDGQLGQGPALPAPSVPQAQTLSGRITRWHQAALKSAFPQALALRGTAWFCWAPGGARSAAGWPLPTLYCTPGGTGAVPSRAAALRLQLLVALRERGLRVLEAALPSELFDALAALRAAWPALADDLELGWLSPCPELPVGTQRQLQALLSPDAARAAELRAECARGFEGIVRRLWPQLQVVVVGTAHVRQEARASASALLSSAPAHPALLGMNLWPEEPSPRFLLCPDWAFCEFLPCAATEPPPVPTALLGELWEGREYELVLTARPGHYRRRAGEVLRVSGFRRQCPVVEPVRRESQTLSVRGERVPEERFLQSLRRAVALWPGARLVDYVCAESALLGASSGAGAPHYEVFVELQGLRDLSEEQRSKVPAARGVGAGRPRPRGGTAACPRCSQDTRPPGCAAAGTWRGCPWRGTGRDAQGAVAGIPGVAARGRPRGLQAPPSPAAGSLPAAGFPHL